MAHIYIFSPSSAVRDKAAFRRGVKRLQALGHEVELDEAALASHMPVSYTHLTLPTNREV